jgi:outer membrane lipoprotein-sorting protein
MAIDPARLPAGPMRAAAVRGARVVKCRVLSLWFLAFASVAAHPAEDGTDGLDTVLQSLSARRHGEVDFVEQHFLSMLKRPLESSGNLLYDAPNRLEKRTLEPRAESLVLNGNILTLQRGRRNQVLDLKTYPQILPFVESIRATLAGDRAALERVFRLEFSGKLARWTLVLTPLDAQVAKSVAQVQIDGSASDLLRVEIRQADGDRSLMTLRARAAP